MVIVAAIALGSSTYAWFVASGSVTAEGMEVKAQAESGLVIRYGTGQWATTASAGMTAAKALNPTSTYTFDAWYHASAEKFEYTEALAGTRRNVTTDVFTAADGKATPSTIKDNNYVVMKQFEVASSSGAEGKSAMGLYVDKITVTGGVSMSTALRVGIEWVGADGVAKSAPRIFAPVDLGGSDAKNKPTTSYAVYSEYTEYTDTSEKELATVTVASVGETAVVIPASQALPLGTSNGERINVYIWYEGEDNNLTSANFATEDLDISIDFKAFNAN